MKYVGLFAMLVALMLTSAFTGATLWGWFIIPLGIAQISYVHAYGLGIVGSFMLGTRGIAGKKPFGETLVEGFMVCAACLLFGYGAHLFM